MDTESVIAAMPNPQLIRALRDANNAIESSAKIIKNSVPAKGGLNFQRVSDGIMAIQQNANAALELIRSHGHEDSELGRIFKGYVAGATNMRRDFRLYININTRANRDGLNTGKRLLREVCEEILRLTKHVKSDLNKIDLDEKNIMKRIKDINKDESYIYNLLNEMRRLE